VAGRWRERLAAPAFAGLANQLVTHFQQFVAIGTAACQQLKGKAVTLPQTVH
jgi:hypothetical protein